MESSAKQVEAVFAAVPQTGYTDTLHALPYSTRLKAL